jgi:hypothetical protein
MIWKSFLLSALVLASSRPPTLTAVESSSSEVQRRTEEPCWDSVREFKNTNPGRHKPIRLPMDLENAPVSHSPVVVKLCISESGRVARALLVQSSGNADVDRFYVKELSARTFIPLQKHSKKVRSVLRVTISVYVK